VIGGGREGAAKEAKGEILKKKKKWPWVQPLENEGGPTDLKGSWRGTNQQTIFKLVLSSEREKTGAQPGNRWGGMRIRG